MMLDSEFERLVSEWLDGRINNSDSELLQQQLRDSATARHKFRLFTKTDAALRELATNDQQQFAVPSDATLGTARPKKGSVLQNSWLRMASAAVVLIAVAVIAYSWGRNDASSKPVAQAESQDSDRIFESTIAGYAMLRRAAGVTWPSGSRAFREGDLLQAGSIAFETGVVEIDFFCGATLVVEGPAQIELESDWSVRCLRGRLRATVPPAARGFIVKAADTEIIDLGTEFALQVGPDDVHVEVVDGEIRLQGGAHHGKHLVTGEGQSLAGGRLEEGAFRDLTTMVDIQERHSSGQRNRCDEWLAYSRELRLDPRLVAYYPIAELDVDRSIPNVALTGSVRDGRLVGAVSRRLGRFGEGSFGVDFSRPGARVRTRIDGQFSAFTFMCWAKIDALDHVYNALFMCDSYETGELHWQIRNDGKLMLSVMVDDTVNVPKFDKKSQKMVTTAGLHRVYFTPSIWDISNSGQWFHIAAVYDPASRRVTQFVNGKQVSSEKIQDEFRITNLRIGPSEIGNWGQPFRDSPWFAVRNLNGTIDELAIFDAALDAMEIQTHFEKGKPLGY